jgi:predicted pyridoxine 5'-phosphate oxidase superfamily flavin-nucleotide-binding protein
MLGDEVRKSARESVLCWLATTGTDGMPNVSPKEMFVPYGNDKIIVANIASPISVRNIQVNNLVCLSFIDIFKQKGYKISGNAQLADKGTEKYEEYLREIHGQLGGEEFPVQSIIDISVQSIQPIVAPSYRIFPETVEQDQITSAMAAYGVRPK